KVDLAVKPLGAAAPVARRLASVDVATSRFLQTRGQRLLGLGAGDLGEVRIVGEPPAGRRGLGLTQRHGSLACFQTRAEDRDGLAGRNLHDRLLPAPRLTGGVAPALGFWLH